MKIRTYAKTTKSKLLIALVGIVVLVGLFLVLKPSNSEAPAPVREYSIEVRNGKLTDNISALAAYEGQSLVFNVASDTTDELHIHGYDQSLQLAPNKESRLEFKADKTGRFEVELHKAKQQLTVLEVKPQP